jgi:hypothetical protein
VVTLQARHESVIGCVSISSSEPMRMRIGHEKSQQRWDNMVESDLIWTSELRTSRSCSRSSPVPDDEVWSETSGFIMVTKADRNIILCKSITWHNS